jgi:gluconate 2-dehydrogenase
MTQKSILVARAIFPEVLEMLSQHFQVESNQSDEVLSAEVLKQKMQGKVGALTTGSERIDVALLSWLPTRQMF